MTMSTQCRVQWRHSRASLAYGIVIIYEYILMYAIRDRTARCGVLLRRHEAVLVPAPDCDCSYRPIATTLSVTIYTHPIRLE